MKSASAAKQNAIGGEGTRRRRLAGLLQRPGSCPCDDRFAVRRFCCMLVSRIVIRSWARFLAVIGIAVAMLGAPCRNCAPKEEPKAPCGHDCCPKPKQSSPVKSCSWMPAGFDAVEKAKESFSPDWQADAVPALQPGNSGQPLERALTVLSEDRPPPQSPPPSPVPLRI